MSKQCVITTPHTSCFLTDSVFLVVDQTKTTRQKPHHEKV